MLLSDSIKKSFILNSNKMLNKKAEKAFLIFFFTANSLLLHLYTIVYR